MSMTYADLLKILQHMKKNEPEKMDDKIVFLRMVPLTTEEEDALTVRSIEYNDGSVPGMKPHQLFLSEV